VYSHNQINKKCAWYPLLNCLGTHELVNKLEQRRKKCKNPISISLKMSPWRSEILSNRADSFFYSLVGVWSSLIVLSLHENRTWCFWWDTLMYLLDNTVQKRQPFFVMAIPTIPTYPIAFFYSEEFVNYLVRF
jgi:hypothetical protein